MRFGRVLGACGVAAACVFAHPGTALAGEFVEIKSDHMSYLANAGDVIHVSYGARSQAKSLTVEMTLSDGARFADLDDGIAIGEKLILGSLDGTLVRECDYLSSVRLVCSFNAAGVDSLSIDRAVTDVRVSVGDGFTGKISGELSAVSSLNDDATGHSEAVDRFTIAVGTLAEVETPLLAPASGVVGTFLALVIGGPMAVFVMQRHRRDDGSVSIYKNN